MEVENKEFSQQQLVEWQRYRLTQTAQMHTHRFAFESETKHVCSSTCPSELEVEPGHHHGSFVVVGDVAKHEEQDCQIYRSYHEASAHSSRQAVPEE